MVQVGAIIIYHLVGHIVLVPVYRVYIVLLQMTNAVDNMVLGAEIFGRFFYVFRHRDINKPLVIIPFNCESTTFFY